jgi:hypothetical protein
MSPLPRTAASSTLVELSSQSIRYPTLISLSGSLKSKILPMPRPRWSLLAFECAPVTAGMGRAQLWTDVMDSCYTDESVEGCTRQLLGSLLKSAPLAANR